MDRARPSRPSLEDVTGFGIGKAVVRVKMGYLQAANESLRT